MNKTDQKTIKTKKFKEAVKTLLDSIEENRMIQMRANRITHPKRDTYIRMKAAGALTPEFFSEEGILIYQRKSKLNREFRTTVSEICEEIVKKLKAEKNGSKN